VLNASHEIDELAIADPLVGAWAGASPGASIRRLAVIEKSKPILSGFCNFFMGFGFG